MIKQKELQKLLDDTREEVSYTKDEWDMIDNFCECILKHNKKGS